MTTKTYFLKHNVKKEKAPLCLTCGVRRVERDRINNKWNLECSYCESKFAIKMKNIKPTTNYKRKNAEDIQKKQFDSARDLYFSDTK